MYQIDSTKMDVCSQGWVLEPIYHYLIKNLPHWKIAEKKTNLDAYDIECCNLKTNNEAFLLFIG